MSYETESQKPASEKEMLAQVEPSGRLVLWELDSGSIWKRKVDHYVIDMKKENDNLLGASSKLLNSGEWFFEYETKTVYVRLADDSDPNAAFMSAIYRLFFAMGGRHLTHNLNGGNPVHYEPLIETVSAFKQQIDNAEQLGISLESQGSISFKATDGFFDDLFDKLFFENKTIRIYSWFPNLPESEVRQIFQGEIENKSYDQDKVTFRIKDFIYKLRQPVALQLFSQSDGVISDDVIGNKFKRRLYGKVKGAKIQSLDMILGGFQLDGTISAVAGSNQITGVGTTFLKDCSPNDTIFIELLFTTLELKIDSIESDTQLTVSEEIETNVSNGTTAILKTDRTRWKNREWHVAAHKLREPTATIVNGLQLNRFEVGSGELLDFFAGDNVIVNGEDATIKRISGNVVVLFQALDEFPQVGWTMQKNPIDSVYFDTNELLIDRDYTISNASECKITFNELAEFNATKRRKVQGTIQFTNGSRNVTGVGTDFKTDFQTRDWIRANDVFNPEWYEILEVVDETNMIIRTAYTGTNFDGIGFKKNVNYMGDDAIVTVDCIGKENESGQWVRTASDVVKDLMSDAGLTNLDLDSFNVSDVQADYIMSLKLPLDPDANEPPIIRDIVSLVNKSVFGSLVAKTDFTIAFNVLTPDRPEDLTELKDDDLIDKKVKVNTKTDIQRRVIGQFNHFDSDRFTGESGHGFVDYENSFVDYLLGSKQEKTVELYLFNEIDAQTMVERYALIHSLTQSIVTVNSKLNLTLKNLNDKIWVSLERLYHRFGSINDRKKVGIISGISRKFNQTTVVFSDLSNMFNRVGAIAPDDAVEFTTASEVDKLKNGYIVDNSTELPSNDNDSTWNTNIIG